MPDKSPFDPERELAFVRAVLADEEPTIREFGDRLRCVPRILNAENVRLGRPLDEHDLADLIQDTVVVILKKLGQFAGSAPLEAWIYRVCCLELMNGIRRKRRAPKLVADTSALFAEGSKNGSTDELAERESVHCALERLDDSEAEAIRLKHFEGLTFQEMGRRLGVSPNTLKTRYYRALIRLEELLGGTDGP